MVDWTWLVVGILLGHVLVLLEAAGLVWLIDRVVDRERRDA